MLKNPQNRDNQNIALTPCQTETPLTQGRDDRQLNRTPVVLTEEEP
jgi:hypothetical protein